MSRVAFIATSLLLLFLAPSAHAYAWMIRNGDVRCSSCHTDPSGGGALTARGRASSDLFLDYDFGRERAANETPAGTSGFLRGAVDLPDSLRLGGDLRGGFLVEHAADETTKRLVLMRSDLYGDLKVWRVRAAGSIGYADTGALNAAITSNASGNLVSREHWLGFELDPEGAWLARAGRIALPFGIRNIEHNLWVRSLTRTDIDDDQQHGVSLYGQLGAVRGEIMGILGNYQVRPDDYRERGYSAYVEVSPAPRLAIGASSLYTRARRDLVYRVTDYRQAHGLFARYAPVAPLVLLAEADWLYQSLTWNGHRAGYAAVLQTDWEPNQGIHFILTVESKNEGGVNESPSYGVWGSAVWFFAPHADFRVDGIFRNLGQATGRIDVVTWLTQLHVYL
jgi:hypothetical protein